MKTYKPIHKFYIKYLRVWKCIDLDTEKNIRSILKASYVIPPATSIEFSFRPYARTCNSLPRTLHCIGHANCCRSTGLFAEFGSPQIN
jgi:hypothetical protein